MSHLLTLLSCLFLSLPPLCFNFITPPFRHGPIHSFFFLWFFLGNLHFPPFFTSPLLSLPLLSLPTLSFLPLTLLSIITSSSLCHYQISACVSGRNTWSTNQHCATASPRTSGSHWSGSLSCSVKRVRCCVPETWDPSSATSSSQSWPTSRLSGVTT